MSLKFPPFPTEVFVAPRLERPQGRTAPFQSVSPPLQLPRWNLAPPVVLLAVRGTLASGAGAHTRGPAAVAGLRPRTQWLPTAGIGQSAVRTHPAWGACSHSAPHKQVVGPSWARSWQVFPGTCPYKVKGPSPHAGFELQLILRESGLPCDFGSPSESTWQVAS